MRTKFKQSPDLFTIPISKAPFPEKLSRDEAPVLLKGLQSIYLDEELNHQVCTVNQQENGFRRRSKRHGSSGDFRISRDAKWLKCQL